LELVKRIRIATRHGHHLGLLLIIPVLPLLVESLDILKEALENSTELIKFDCVLPRGVLQPGDGVFVNLIKRSVTLEEEV